MRRTRSVVGEAWLARVRAEPDQRRAPGADGRTRRATCCAGSRRSTRWCGRWRASDPEIAELQDEFERRRRADIRGLVLLLVEAGPLRVPVDEAVDLMWALSRSTGLYRSLTVDRRWSDRRARAALTDVLAGLHPARRLGSGVAR